MKYARTPQDRQRARQLLDLLNRPAALVSAGPVSAPTTKTTQLPPGLSTASGNLIELVCTGPVRQIVLETRSGRKQFLLDDPNKIVFEVVGQIDLSCGERKRAAPLELGFIAAPSGSTADGLVRSLKFGTPPSH